MQMTAPGSLATRYPEKVATAITGPAVIMPAATATRKSRAVSQWPGWISSLSSRGPTPRALPKLAVGEGIRNCDPNRTNILTHAAARNSKSRWLRSPATTLTCPASSSIRRKS